jgi:hypothetical protein
MEWWSRISYVSPTRFMQLVNHGSEDNARGRLSPSLEIEGRSVAAKVNLTKTGGLLKGQAMMEARLATRRRVLGPSCCLSRLPWP